MLKIKKVPWENDEIQSMKKETTLEKKVSFNRVVNRFVICVV